jgi:hypothetical protein
MAAMNEAAVMLHLGIVARRECRQILTRIKDRCALVP